MFGSKDPVEREIKALKREQQELSIGLKFDGAKPGDDRWKAAEARSKEIHREIRKLERGK